MPNLFKHVLCFQGTGGGGSGTGGGGSGTGGGSGGLVAAVVVGAVVIVALLLGRRWNKVSGRSYVMHLQAADCN